VVPTALPAYVELPAEGWEAALDVLAGTDRGAKLRTGGSAGLSIQRVAAVLSAAAARNVPIKATGGLHRAVRQVDGGTGQHGFLNLLLGAAAARRRADPVPALSERDGAVLAAAVATLDPAVRRLFVGFGCCDVTAPLDDLRQLGLL
jgi:hypothetical protein